MNFKNILMIAVLFLFSCSNEDDGVLNTTKFKIGNNYTLDETKSLEITKIEDSRCPIGVTCVREGEAKVFFRLIEGNTIKTDSTFVIGKGAKIDTIFTNLIVNITAVNPFPEKDKTVKQSDYTLEMKVTKL